jgi:hypothetical protein
MGLLIGGAVFPAAFAITWKKQTRVGAIAGCLSGLSAGLIAWLTTAKQYYGVITIATTGQEYPTLAGNLAAIMTGLIVSVSVSLINPDNFNSEVTRAINAISLTPRIGVNDQKTGGEVKEVDRKEQPSLSDSPTSSVPAPASTSTIPNFETEEALHMEIGAEDHPHKLRAAFKLACVASCFLTLIMDFLIPMPMFFAEYIFSKGFFTAWVVISFIWVFCSSFVSCFLPIWETRGFFGELMGKIVKDLRVRKG